MPGRRHLIPLGLVALVAGCGDYKPPPPHVAFEGLPVSGSLSDARFAGFTNCMADNVSMRCRRDGIRILDQGPFNAAVDLTESDGSGGFDQLTLWYDDDQSAVFALGQALERQGWRTCSTGENDHGDQAIYWRPGAPVRFSMDISYWSKRRVRVIPAWNHRDRGC